MAAKLTADNLARWQADPVAFAKEACIMRRPDGTLGPPVLSDRQRSWLTALAAQKDGKRQYRQVVVIAPKRSGKTTIGGIALLWASLGEDRRSACLANSRESATSLGFDVAADLVKRGPLAGAAKVQRNKILFPALNTEIVALPCEAATVAGIGVNGLLLSDELWAASDEEPFRLLRAQASSDTSCVLVVSQASGLQSEVYRLYEAGQADPPVPGLFVDYVAPEELRAGLQLSPARTPEYLALEKATSIEAVFEHYHLNEWGGAGGNFLDADVLAACDEDFEFPRTSEDFRALAARFAAGGRIVVAGGLDRALPYAGHDESAFVFVAVCPGPEHLPVFRLVGLSVLKTGAAEDITAAFARARATFGPVSVIAETYQCADLALAQGWELRAASPQAQLSGFTMLHRLASEGRLRWPAGPEADAIREQLGRLKVDTSGPQPKFSGGKRAAVDDVCFAAMWAVVKANETAPIYYNAGELDFTPVIVQGYTGGCGDENSWFENEPTWYEFDGTDY